MSGTGSSEYPVLMYNLRVYQVGEPDPYKPKLVGGKNLTKWVEGKMK